jgi:hypothetical protein
MKPRHIIISIPTFLVACSNPKADIVEKQKLLYDSIKNIQARADARLYLLDNGLNEDGDKLTNENGFDLSPSEAHRIAIDDKVRGKWFRMVDSAFKLKRQYDSLEIELKKY